MTSPVYTVLLGRQVVSAGSAILVPSPPGGFRYVITDMEAWNFTGPSVVPLRGFIVIDSSDGVIWGNSMILGGQGTYHWRGRQVIDVGDQATAFTTDTGWGFRASGFQLTLP